VSTANGEGIEHRLAVKLDHYCFTKSTCGNVTCEALHVIADLKEAVKDSIQVLEVAKMTVIKPNAGGEQELKNFLDHLRSLL